MKWFFFPNQGKGSGASKAQVPNTKCINKIKHYLQHQISINLLSNLATTFLLLFQFFPLFPLKTAPITCLSYWLWPSFSYKENSVLCVWSLQFYEFFPWHVFPLWHLEEHFTFKSYIIPHLWPLVSPQAHMGNQLEKESSLYFSLVMLLFKALFGHYFENWMKLWKSQAIEYLQG